MKYYLSADILNRSWHPDSSKLFDRIPDASATGLVGSLYFSSIHRTKQGDWLGSNHSGGVACRVGRSQWLVSVRATFDPINLPSPEALQVKLQSLHRHCPLCPLDGQ
ncbi:hypothetical protein PGT21_016744 [Puccinia graminis f. sp. tritici]|uniref:Uncharacterized protein n=1 Tax=Puccinia graminis f. sp. tritici TaxID=56615 RepID=A0A5B0Q316_PUCGR|nr:hypothetical protein PGT21_016744 [Puccinia graminis f. sp. tritici]KAA1124690.1 hypothetical protein PGTUg99_029716 [Puccinia graminis f. sp. tritici]